MQAFDVSHWYRGANDKVFTANHHIATTLSMLRMYAPKVFLFDKVTTLDEHNLGIQVHVAVLLKFLLLHDNYDKAELFDKDGCSALDLDDIFLRLRSRYSQQLEEINTQLVPEIAQMLASKHRQPTELIKLIHRTFLNKE